LEFTAFFYEISYRCATIKQSESNPNICGIALSLAKMTIDFEISGLRRRPVTLLKG